MDIYETKQIDHEYIKIPGDNRIYSPIDYNLSLFDNERDNEYLEKYRKLIRYGDELYIPNIEKFIKINLVPENIDKKNIFNFPQELLNNQSYNEMYDEYMIEEKELNEQDNIEINYNDDIMIKNLDY